MKYRYLLMTILLVFTACGSGGDSDGESINEVEALNPNSSFKRSSKTVTIYVHGYKKGGYKEEQNYGETHSSDFTDKLVVFTGLPTLESYDNDFSDIITGVEYYGDQAPDYYTQDDIEDIKNVTDQYGGGIPRYALIVAKYAKHVLAQTGAKRVNIVSVSMGSLITRWMIEKNVENLASDKKIEKWMTTEGVLRGNYGLSKLDDIGVKLIRDTINSFFEDSAETKQMKYNWIEENLTPNRDTMESLYYADILVGQISLTDSENHHAGLKYIMMQEDFQPNDGYQLVKDTYFAEIENAIQTPSHTLIHTDHIGITQSDATFRTISNFLKAQKRVRITLLDVTVTDIHETITALDKKSETVFASLVSVEEAKVLMPMSERAYDGGTLNIYHYKKDGETQTINQILFDDFVPPTETNLYLNIKGYEIDRSTKYQVSEVKTGKKESMGESVGSVELKNGTYPISADDWSGHIQVEVLEM